MTIGEANTAVLKHLAKLDESTVLGFLPVEQAEGDAILEAVRLACDGNVKRVWEILDWEAPAATVFAFAVAVSRRCIKGGECWPALDKEFGLKFDGPQTKRLADSFQKTCASLGVLEWAEESGGFRHAMPVIFQAGILHNWTDDLVAGLKSTLKRMPSPDLEDESAVRQFSDQLVANISGNFPILKRVMATAVGPMVCQRLFSARDGVDLSLVPVHLRKPIRDAFEEVGAGASLRSPYLAFDDVRVEFELVLPRQSSRLATGETFWNVEGRHYRAMEEHRLSTRDLGGDFFTVQLRQLDRGYNDQRYTLDARLDSDKLFRIFRADTGREKLHNGESSIQLKPGDYLLVMAPELVTNDEEYVNQDIGAGFRWLAVELRPGGKPLVLNWAEREWELKPALRPGLFTDRAHALPLQEEGWLHFGKSLGLLGYFPAEGLEQQEFEIGFQCKAQELEQLTTLTAQADQSSAFLFHGNLDKEAQPFLDKLPFGIHFLEVSLSHANRRVQKSFWYWKGLLRVSEGKGFVFSEPPENLNWGDSRGIEQICGGAAFAKDYHAPSVQLALSQPKETLKLARPGVHCEIVESGEVLEELLSTDIPLVVGPDDRRSLRVETGGFQEWTLLCQDQTLVSLDKNKTTRALSLKALAAQFGGSGKLIARSERGREITLANFVQPLTATSPTLESGAFPVVETWRFRIPTEGLQALAVRITDLSSSASAPASEPKLICEKKQGKFDSGEYPLTEEIAAQLLCEEDYLDVSICPLPQAIPGNLVLLDFLCRKEAEDEWYNLECQEPRGVAGLRIVIRGTEGRDNGNWWRALLQAKRPVEPYWADAGLAEALAQADVKEVQPCLQTCRELLEWKYPTEVWAEAASQFQDLPVHLGHHWFARNPDTAALWWREGVQDLVRHAQAEITPVTRQFLLGAHPASLSIASETMDIDDAQLGGPPLQRSLLLPAHARKHQSLAAFVRVAYDLEIDSDFFEAFKNFNEVSRGQADRFKRFSFKTFLGNEKPRYSADGPMAPSSGLWHRADALNEREAKIEVKGLLTPEHLLKAVKALNHRCRIFEDISQQNDQNHPLAGLLQTLTRLSGNLEMAMSVLNNHLGWDMPHLKVWHPPCLGSSWGRKVAGLAFALAAHSRVAASGRLPQTVHQGLLNDIFQPTAPPKALLPTRIGQVLSLAPELFAFYYLLFDLVLWADTPNQPKK
jgi:hypothetical protein